MQSFEKKDISFVLPCLNEEKGIRDCLLRIKETIARLRLNAEIIVADNGSTDKSAEIAMQEGAKVVYENKKGYGSAYKRGFKEARGKLIAALDADGTYDPKDIEKMLSVMADKKADFVSGNRLKNISKKAMPITIVLGNHLFSLLFNLLFFTWISDTQSGIWLFKRKLLESMPLKDDGMGLSSEIKLRAYKKFVFCEVPVSYAPRYGEKKLNIVKHSFQVLKYFLKQRINY